MPKNHRKNLVGHNVKFSTAACGCEKVHHCHSPNVVSRLEYLVAVLRDGARKEISIPPRSQINSLNPIADEPGRIECLTSYASRSQNHTVCLQQHFSAK